MIILLSILTFTYCFCILWLYWHWLQIPVGSPQQTYVQELPFMTVVIPVRNEAENILALLQDIAGQRTFDGGLFPSGKLEIMVVDDHSEDETRLLVEKYQKDSKVDVQLLAIELPPGFKGSHKKMAITQAIKKAKGNIIITTDGDCRVGTYWLISLHRFFLERQAVLVSGPVTFHHEKDLFQHLQTIEFASLVGTGAASLQAHRPNMCNGANLAFQRKVFFEVGGYAGSFHVPSGDDEFLMQKVFQKFPQQVFFLKNPEVVVYTWAKSSLKEFYDQRRRWAGKWKLHKNKWVVVLAVFIFTYHLSCLTALMLVIAGKYPWSVLLLQMLPRVMIEFFFLRNVLHFMKKKMSIPNFLVLEFIYSAYVVFFGICANFGGFTWKNRHYN